MKIRRPLFFAVVAASAVSLASIAVSAVAAETPFKGTVNAVETVEPSSPRPPHSSGRHGHRHVSRQVHRAHRVDRSTFRRVSTGAATFTAANGDTLTTTVVGRATPTTPGVLSIVEDYTITGGTGRFAGATGTFTLQSTLDPDNGR